MKTKIHKWVSLALILSALVALSVVAFATDGYTEVGTTAELLTALSGDADKIRLTDDIYAISGDTNSITINRDVEVDLNNHTWGGFTLSTASAEDKTPVVTISNGNITLGDNNCNIISHMSGSLTLTNIVMNGKLSLGAGTTTAIDGCTITRTAPNPEGSYLNGDYCAIAFYENWGSDYAQITSISNSIISGYYIGINMAFGSIDSIANSHIEGMVGDGITVTTYVDQSTPTTIGEISASQITGGEEGYAIRLQAGRADDEIKSAIGEISDCNLIGGKGGINGGTIGTLHNCDIYGEYFAVSNFTGTITAITDCTLRADGAYGKGIENTGTISTISGCTFEASYTSLHNHPGGHIGSVTGNTINAPIPNGGTIDALTDNIFTIPEEGAIDNNAFEDNAFGESSIGVITVCENNTFAETEIVEYTMQFARQIRLYEPWGVRVSVMVNANGTALELENNSAIESIGMYFLQGGAHPTQDTLTAKGIWVAGEYNELLSTTQDVFSSDFIGIQTNKLDETVYYMACLKMADGTTVYSEIRSLSLIDLLNAGADNSNMSYEERNVYRAILNWFEAYQNYLNR